jgi:AbrB family looped-hinge helix DNA binding protein
MTGHLASNGWSPAQLPNYVAIAKPLWHTFAMHLKVDKLGRVVLPKPLRARYGLRPGTELEISEGPQEFSLRPASSGPSLVEIDGILVHQGVPRGELDIVKAIREDREERLQHLSDME